MTARLTKLLERAASQPLSNNTVVRGTVMFERVATDWQKGVGAEVLLRSRG